MFGKTKEFTEQIDESATTDIAIDDFFGDEAAVAEAVRVDALRQRVTSVEQQIHSQFTSMAAYAQIAQEQVELVRSESQHAVERSEQKMVSLIERERADRISGSGGTGSSTPDVTARLDALEVQVADIRNNLQQCLSNQKALAEAITELFAQPITTEIKSPSIAESTPHVDDATASSPTQDDGFDVFAAPDIATVDPMAHPPAPPAGGPIAELSLD